VRAANGNVNGQAYDGSGNLTEERHADGGVVRHLYNAFGNRTRMVDAMGNTVRYELDKLGRVVAMHRGSAYVNGVDGNNNLIPGVLRDIVVTTAYDQAGRQLWIANGAGETTRFTYDLRGNVTEARQPLGQATRSVFDALNRKIAEVDANELAATWNTDYFGQLQGHTDLGGHRQVYAYSRAGQLTEETGSRGQHKGYAYDGAGQLTRIDDYALNQQSLYTFDAAGNRTGEKTIQNGIIYQDNLLAYDGQNRLRQLNALGGVQIKFDYDQAGNRLHQENGYGVPDIQQVQVLQGYTTGLLDESGQPLLLLDAAGQPYLSPLDAQGNPIGGFDESGNPTPVTPVYREETQVVGQATQVQHLYYAYDAMNRQILVDGAHNGNAGDLSNLTDGQGRLVGYDKNGNRISDTFWGNRVTRTGGDTSHTLLGYTSGLLDESGNPLLLLDESGQPYLNPTDAFGNPIGGVDESGNPTPVTPVYQDVTTPVAYSVGEGLTTETYRYDGLNRLARVEREGTMIDTRLYDGADRVVHTGPGGTLAQEYIDKLNDGPVGNGSETRVNRYDANGRLLHQRVLKSDGEAKYDIDYGSYDDAGNVTAYTMQNHGEGGFTAHYAYTLQRFDGYKEAVIDGSRDDNTYDPGKTVNGYDVNGNLVSVQDSTKGENNRSFINDAGGVALQKSQQGHVLTQLVVDGQVFGQIGSGIDPSMPLDNDGNQRYLDFKSFNLGYRPIDSNYPTASVGTYTVAAGDTLESIAQGAYGDGKLWYLIADANGLESDSHLKVGQTLSLPNRVGTIHNDARSFKPYEPGKIVGDTTPNLPAPSNDGGCGGFGQILVAVIAIIVAVYTGIYVGGGLQGAVIGAAAGSVVSQGVAMAIGIQDRFSWEQVAFAALSAGITQGIPLPGVDNVIVNQAIRGAFNNAVNQGLRIAVGMQDKFSWAAVAASAIAAPIANEIGNAVGGALGGTIGQIAGGFARGFTSQVLVTGMTGGKIRAANIAADAFGNALGDSLGSQIRDAWNSDTEQAQDFARENARFQRQAPGAGYTDQEAQQDLNRERTRFGISPMEESEQARFRQAEIGTALGSSIAGQIGQGSQQYSELEQAQDMAKEMNRGSWKINAQAGQPALFASSGVIMSDLDNPYLGVDIGGPRQPNPADDARFNQVFDAFSAPRSRGGVGIVLDDFGNPVTMGSFDGASMLEPQTMMGSTRLIPQTQNFDSASLLNKRLGGFGDVENTNALKQLMMDAQTKNDPGFTSAIRDQMGVFATITGAIGLSDKANEVVRMYTAPQSDLYSDLHAMLDPVTRNLAEGVTKEDLYAKAQSLGVRMVVQESGITNSVLQSYSNGLSLAMELEAKGTPSLILNAYNATQGSKLDVIESALEKAGMNTAPVIGTRIAIQEAMAYNNIMSTRENPIFTQVWGHSEGSIIVNQAVEGIDPQFRSNIDLRNFGVAIGTVPSGVNTYIGVGNVNDFVYQSVGQRFTSTGGIMKSDNFIESNLQRPGSYQFTETDFKVANGGQPVPGDANHSWQYYMSDATTRQSLGLAPLTTGLQSYYSRSAWVGGE
jgi:YD repeat-containing protein